MKPPEFRNRFPRVAGGYLEANDLSGQQNASAENKILAFVLLNLLTISSKLLKNITS